MSITLFRTVLIVTGILKKALGIGGGKVVCYYTGIYEKMS